VRRGAFETGAEKYQYRDRLNSSVIECNESAQVISYEEYYPYGASAYRASRSSQDLSLKRYRFTGKERDEETGLDYFGVRYYASWLGRWTSGDPGGFVDGLNLYRYARNNPVTLVDEEGMKAKSPDSVDDIIIILEDGTQIVYVPQISDTRNDEFAITVANGLDEIYSTDIGRQVINRLSNSATVYTIREAEILAAENQLDGRLPASFGLAMPDGRNAIPIINQNLEDGNVRNAVNIVENAVPTIGVFTGDIERAWNRNLNIQAKEYKVQMNFILLLGHEIFHAYQYDLGGEIFIGLQVAKRSDIKLAEVQAVAFENNLRGQLFAGTKFEKIRRGYSGAVAEDFKLEEQGVLSSIFGYSFHEAIDFSRDDALTTLWITEYIQQARETYEELEREEMENQRP
jgi:RHS repeat-associated protein